MARGAAHAFRDVLAGHFQMDAAGIGAFGAMDREERADFAHDPVERPRLVAGGRDRVAVHRVGRPDDLAALALHGADQGGQVFCDLVRTETADQRHPPRLVGRVEDVEKLD